jgi:DNA-binding IclR family transcriptional regulator
MKSLQKIFQVIELLKENREMKLQEIADTLGLYKSTAHRLTSELCRNGYLQRSAETKAYQLGMKFVDISSHIIDNMDIRELSKPGIRHLNDVTRETIHLAMLIDKQVIYVDKMESPHAIRMYSQIGKVAPLHCTGVGKAILAFQSPEMISQMLDSGPLQKYTGNTIVTRDALMRELALIHKNNVAFDREEHEPHVGCIAGPLWDHTGKVVASISITAVLYNLKMEDLMAFKDLLLATCTEVSKSLGFRERANRNEKESNERPVGHRSPIQKVSKTILIRRK